MSDNCHSRLSCKGQVHSLFTFYIKSSFHQYIANIDHCASNSSYVSSSLGKWKGKYNEQWSMKKNK